MGTFIHATGSRKKGNRVFRLHGPWGERRLPEIRTRSDLDLMLARELELPPSAGRKDIVEALLDRDWDTKSNRWVDDFRTQLRRAREVKGWTQSQLAEQSDLSLQAISALEQGTRSATWDTVRKLTRALGKQFQVWLLEGESQI